ncbi:MAG TPA: hypothetical protein VNK43_09060, partial [Gemmatimonadales bacterium]|nr:hypothetical protein [Gemmatimonadales bacterium]
MGPKSLGCCLLLAIALAGCGGGGEAAADEDAAVDLAALRARRDSVRQARAAADSAARVRWTACTDSVTAEMRKTPAG